MICRIGSGAATDQSDPRNKAADRAAPCPLLPAPSLSLGRDPSDFFGICLSHWQPRLRPGRNLYFNYSSDLANGGANSTLYTVNTSTGALTTVGNGLGSDILALFSDGNALYGIDANVTSDIGVFRIDTATGVATQVSTVTGLPGSDSFFVDAATVSTPDTGSTFALFIFALAPLLGESHLRRCLKTSS
jgi:hypothetical protein